MNTIATYTLTTYYPVNIGRRTVRHGLRGPHGLRLYASGGGRPSPGPTAYPRQYMHYVK